MAEYIYLWIAIVGVYSLVMIYWCLNDIVEQLKRLSWPLERDVETERWERDK